MSNDHETAEPNPAKIGFYFIILLDEGHLLIIEYNLLRKKYQIQLKLVTGDFLPPSHLFYRKNSVIVT